MNPIEWCKSQIQKAQENADYRAWQDYQELLKLWEQKTK